jgi:glycosyltransferase involved in cell wall biosynthesis
MNLSLLPDLRGVIGGPATFQALLAGSLEKQGIAIQYDLDRSLVDTLLLINASRHIGHLLRLKKQGVRIVQRLGTPTDYMKSLSLPLMLRIKNSITISYMAWIRRHLANVIVYQSHFVCEEWNNVHGFIPNKQEVVIHNGVDTLKFTPIDDRYISPCSVCIISVEGNQGTDPYNIALNLTSNLISQGFDAELLMLGNPWRGVDERMKSYPFVHFVGYVDRPKIPFYLRGADAFISTDIIAGCPNSVLESLSCGTPVVGYNCGVLKELVEGHAGVRVDPEGDPWKGQNPGNINALSKAIQDIVSNRDVYRSAARQLALRKYSADCMARKYKEILFS